MRINNLFLLLLTPNLLSFYSAQCYQGEALFVHNLSSYITIADSILQQLYSLAKPCEKEKVVSQCSTKIRPLLTHFSELSIKIPYVVLGDLPTPVQHLKRLGAHLGCNNMYSKRDDVTGIQLENGQRLFGGNKIRKLEFLLADALNNGAQSVMTFGCAGSNHAVATTVCADYLGLKSISMLKTQPNSHVVRRNLLLMDYYGSEIQFCPDSSVRGLCAMVTFFQQKSAFGVYPYVIPTGGSCPIGVLGFVNAVFELKEQIEQGLLPEPDRIYVAAGSFGTIAGLLLGVKAAGLKSQIIGVAVEPEEVLGEFKKMIIQLFHGTNKLLHESDSTFPLFDMTEQEVVLLMAHGGTEYGLFTQEAAEAIVLLKEQEGIILDGTYTGKAMAGLIADVTENNHHDDVILFWNTFYGDDYASVIKYTDYVKLPKALHHFFESSVQEFDNA
ncbi:MAG: pyridoxal-phosphate dependent enzyme [Candidatus Dependentiae bacterium]|nr:pyridoxal-phosphate dependent enzyme [Candidatus Dependentiae bacterium]